MKQKNKVTVGRSIKAANKKDKTDWQRLSKMSDREIDCSEIPAMSNFDWTAANIVIPEAKTRLTIRIDTDVYQFFKSTGAKYQSRINAVLKAYVGSQTKRTRRALKKAV